MKGKTKIARMINSANDGNYTAFKGYLEEAIEKRFAEELNSTIEGVRSSLFQEEKAKDTETEGLKGKKGSKGVDGVAKKGKTEEDPAAKKVEIGKPTLAAGKAKTESYYDRNGDWLYEKDDDDDEEEGDEGDDEEEGDEGDDDEDEDEEDEDDKAEAKLKEESYKMIQEIHELKESVFLLEMNGHLMESDSENFVDDLNELEEGIKDNLKTAMTKAGAAVKSKGEQYGVGLKQKKGLSGQENRVRSDKKKAFKAAGGKMGQFKRDLKGIGSKIAKKAGDAKTKFGEFKQKIKAKNDPGSEKVAVKA